MQRPDLRITSLQNPRVKEVVKLAKRSHRDELGILIVEGYREIRRALENHIKPLTLFYSAEWFLGENEPALIEQCRQAGAEIFDCSKDVFSKMAYRDRPEGLLLLTHQIKGKLADLKVPENPLLIVAEAVEKPGNLGTILRSSDAAGVHAVIVCDPNTDINNPNVVRASIGTLFSLPVVEASTAETLAWLRERKIQILAATPHTDREYSDADMTKGTAIVVGAEQYGLSTTWMEEADEKVKIPMLGQCDSLNVASATTILLYEAVRQRRSALRRTP